VSAKGCHPGRILVNSFYSRRPLRSKFQLPSSGTLRATPTNNAEAVQNSQTPEGPTVTHLTDLEEPGAWCDLGYLGRVKASWIQCLELKETKPKQIKLLQKVIHFFDAAAVFPIPLLRDYLIKHVGVLRNKVQPIFPEQASVSPDT
jgi:hypothetical protein